MPKWGDYNAYEEWGAPAKDKDGLREPAWRGDVICAVLGKYVDRRRERILDKQFFWSDTPPVAAILAAARRARRARRHRRRCAMLQSRKRSARGAVGRDIIHDREGDYGSWPAALGPRKSWSTNYANREGARALLVFCRCSGDPRNNCP